jgi:hypothetical protein
MSLVEPCELPPTALLRRYLIGGAYADCFVTEIAATIAHAQFVEAFYTTPAIRIERWILRFACSRPSSDLDARQLAQGERASFAAWNVEERSPNQLLLADFTGRTRSWLMVEAGGDAGAEKTRLYFGSAVVPARGAGSGPPKLGVVFGALLGFHKIYSRVLLSAARARLLR